MLMHNNCIKTQFYSHASGGQSRLARSLISYEEVTLISEIYTLDWKASMLVTTGLKHRGTVLMQM